MSQFSFESDTMTLNFLVVILPWNSSLSSVSTFIVSGQKALCRFMTQWLILFQGKLSPFSSPPTHPPTNICKGLELAALFPVQ